MASIVTRNRKDGGVSYQVRWLEDGRQQATTAATEAAATRIKKIVEATGTFTEEMGRPDVPTVNAQAETFLTEHTTANADTLREYRRIVAQHITPVFGDVALTALSKGALTSWANGLTRHDRGHVGEPVSDKTRGNVTAIMFGILESAVPKWLPANPWRKVKLTKTDGPRDRHFIRSVDFAKILAEIPEFYRLAVTVLATTGLRWGELAGLLVADLDLSSGLPVLRVTKAIKHRAKQGDAAGVPKTEKAVRFVACPPELADVFRALVKGRPATAPLFPTVRGKRLRNSTFHTLVWQPALDRAQDPKKHDEALTFRPRIHDLRAAATTWLIEAGMRMDEVADLMGHESVETTSRIYRRSNPEAGRKAAAAMSGILTEATRALPQQG